MNPLNNDLNGWLVINKDLGMTSRQVVNIIKKTLNVKKIGHAGTLDPLATGVLALAVGRKATKMVKYIMDGMKKYSFTIKWGISTDTQDAEGKIIAKSNKKLDKIKLNSVLKSFIGEKNQIPPKFSAVKVKGRRAYDLARSGKDFSLKPKKVFLKKIKVVENKIDKNNYTKFEIESGKGFYVRSLVRDICKKLNMDGYVIELKRIESEPFNLESSISIKDFLRLHEKNDWKNNFLPIYSVLNKIKYVGK